MNKLLNRLKLATLLAGTVLFVVPSTHAFAYTTPYYVSRLNNSIEIGFQDAQVVAIDNTVYISSYDRCSVFKIVNGQQTQNVAGIPGHCGYTPDGSIASESTLEGPTSIDVATDGTVYIAEPAQYHVRAVLPDGTLTTVAGNNTYTNPSLHTDAPNATQTPFSNPTYLKVGPDNNLYVYDSGVIRRILADGSTDHVAGAFGAYPNNNPYVEGGVATEHTIIKNGAPDRLHFDFDQTGNLFLASGNEIYKINKSEGTVHTYHTYPAEPQDTLEDAPLSNVDFNGLSGFEVDGNGNIWGSSRNTSAGVGLQYLSQADQIVRTIAGGGSLTYPPLIGSGVTPIAGNDLELVNLKSISVENDRIYFISRHVNNVGEIINYVGYLSTSQDSTPPIIQASLSSSPDENGWNNTPVTLSWDVYDPDSTISNKSGCEAIQVSDTNNMDFTCTATSVGGTASQSITVKVDSKSPTMSNPSWSQNPITTSTTTTLTVPTSDDTSGIQRAEYFIGDTDPGQGNGTAMTVTDLSTNNLSANLTTTLGSDLQPGTYKVSIRVQDIAGNWSSLAESVLTVTEPEDSVPPVVNSISMTGGLAIPFIGSLIWDNITTVHASVNDNLSGVALVEYYIDTDPGVGYGHSMFINNNTASVTVDLSGLYGFHLLYIRAQDTANNWSSSVGYLFLTF